MPWGERGTGVRTADGKGTYARTKPPAVQPEGERKEAAALQGEAVEGWCLQ